MAKRSATELWAALEELTSEAEIEEVLAMTPEQVRRELEAAGFDLEKVHATADALGELSARQEDARPATASDAAPGGSAKRGNRSDRRED